MKAKKQGPRNVGVLDLTRYRFPITAITSILHRISGLVLFLLIPLLLCLFERSLLSEASYRQVFSLLSAPLSRFLLWLGLSALVYHLLAGLKHLLMDFGLFEGRESGKYTSIVVMVLGVLYAAALGVLLW